MGFSVNWVFDTKKIYAVLKNIFHAAVVWIFVSRRFREKYRLPSVKTLGTLDKNLACSWISW